MKSHGKKSHETRDQQKFPLILKNETILIEINASVGTNKTAVRTSAFVN